MAVMREAGREGRSIEKGVIGIPLRELDLGAESQHSACGRITGMGDMRTCRSKALISRHLAMMASSSFGKSIDILGNPHRDPLERERGTEMLLSRLGSQKGRVLGYMSGRSWAGLLTHTFPPVES